MFRIENRRQILKAGLAGERNQALNPSAAGNVETQIMRSPLECACGGGCPRCAGVQAKLKVNPPGDRYEQEADSLADQLMRMPAPAIQRAPT
jgi:hypothetical protein